MFRIMHQFLNQLKQADEEPAKLSLNLAIAALLCQVSQADHEIAPQELNVMQQRLKQLLQLSDQEADQLLTDATQISSESTSIYDFTDKLRELGQIQRYQLIEAMWQVAYADHEIDPIEEAIIRRCAELLYVNHQDFIRAKLAVTG